MKRVHWNEDQIESLALAFVKRRCADPFTHYGQLLDAAQDECFQPDEQRPLASINVVPLLKDRIKYLYAKAMGMDPNPPQIIEIPVEKPLDYMELASRLDLPSLMALITQKISTSFSHINFNGNGAQPSATAKAAPPISLLASKPEEKPRPPRVLFASADHILFQKIQSEVERQKIPVEVRGWDIERDSMRIAIQADFVIFPKKATGGPAFHTARMAYPEKRVFVLADNTPETAVQKLRDIISMNVRVPALITKSGPAGNRVAA